MASSETHTASPLGALVERALARHLGASVEVDAVGPLGGGASREIVAVDLRLDGEPRELVMRRDPDAIGDQAWRHEFELIAAADRQGVPVPKPIFALEDGDGLGAGFLMERVRGETLAPRILKLPELEAARERLTRDCAVALAKIHKIPVAELSFLEGVDPVADPAVEQLEHWRAVLDRLGEPHPVLEWALVRLRQALPAPGPRTVVHGDFRNGNLVVGPDGLRAVLDWELSHGGDPMEDLGWLCVRAWRFSRPELAVGGFGTREQLFAAYEEAGGGAVDPRRVRFWETFGNFKWAVICMLQAHTYFSGEKPSLELAAIGRRTCEPEWELLRMLDRAVD
jgi:aminoglycoside phosphotransferase (APT) family kinase protein